MPDIPLDRFVPSADPVSGWKAWVEHLSPVFETTPLPESRVDASVTMRSYNLGSVLVGEINAPAQRIERKARMAAQQGVDHVVIQLYRSGTCQVRTERGERRVTASDFVIYDLSQPITMSAGPVTATNILLPRALLGGRSGDVASLHGSVFNVALNAATHLFASYLHEVVAQIDRVDSHYASGIAEAAASLCGAALPSPDRKIAATERQTSLEIRSFIQQHLADPALGQEMICAAFGMSRATLYRQFEAEDGVQSYIRNRRLTRGMQLLTQPAEGPRPRVSSVAYATGFTDEKTFSRAFRRRFGFLPREAAAERGIWPLRTAAGRPLDHWIRQLGG